MNQVVVKAAAGHDWVTVWAAIAATGGAVGLIFAASVALRLGRKADRRLDKARLAATKTRAWLVLVEPDAIDAAGGGLALRVTVTNWSGRALLQLRAANVTPPADWTAR